MKLYKKTFLILILLLTGYTNLLASVQHPTTLAEKNALIAVYASTNGNNWIHQDNWMTGDPCVDEWYGVTCSWDGNITQLSLDSNNLIGTIPTEIGDLFRLTYLSLYTNQLAGIIPTEIKNLTLLDYIIMFDNYYLYSNDISVQTFIDNVEIGNSYIEIYDSNNASEDYFALLDLYDSTNGDNWINSTNWKLGDPCTNNWFGVLCDPNDLHVIKIQMPTNNLSGNLPENIDSFENLTHLYLHNNKIGGNIPSQIGYMGNLIELSLGYNNLTGSIPPSIGNLETNLTHLSLHNNKLIGSIPIEITYLNNLTHLYLYYNCYLYTNDSNIQSFIDLVEYGNDYQEIFNTNTNDCNNIAPIIMYLLN